MKRMKTMENPSIRTHLPDKLLLNKNKDDDYILTFSTEIRLNEHIHLLTELAFGKYFIKSSEKGMVITNTNKFVPRPNFHLLTNTDKLIHKDIAKRFYHMNSCYLSNVFETQDNILSLQTPMLNMESFLTFTKKINSIDINVHWANQHLIQIDIYLVSKE